MKKQNKNHGELTVMTSWYPAVSFEHVYRMRLQEVTRYDEGKRATVPSAVIVSSALTGDVGAISISMIALLTANRPQNGHRIDGL